MSQKGRANNYLRFPHLVISFFAVSRESFLFFRSVHLVRAECQLRGKLSTAGELTRKNSTAASFAHLTSAPLRVLPKSRARAGCETTTTVRSSKAETVVVHSSGGGSIFLLQFSSSLAVSFVFKIATWKKNRGDG